jgi:hypothetical protein
VAGGSVARGSVAGGSVVTVRVGLATAAEGGAAEGSEGEMLGVGVLCPKQACATSKSPVMPATSSTRFRLISISPESSSDVDTVGY